MQNPFRYIERLMAFQHRYSPVVPLTITRKIHTKYEAAKSWVAVYWMCGHYFYRMIVFEGATYFSVEKFEMITPSDYLPSMRGYYETVSFHLSCIMFDEIEFTGNDREKLIPLERKIKVQTIKEQCFI